MTKVIAIISGKGGVGKTTLAVNTAAALVGFGRHPVVVDGDLHHPNVSMHLGSPNLPVSINTVLDGEHTVSQAMYLHPCGVRVVPASISYNDSIKARHGDLHIIIDQLQQLADIIFLDAPCGLGNEARSVIAASDSVIAITTPDLSSVTDAMKSVRLASELHKDVIGVVVNNITSEAELSLTNIATLMEIPVLTAIPHDLAILESLRLKHPVVFSHPESIACIRFKELAALVIGEKYESKMSLVLTNRPDPRRCYA